MGTRTLLVPAVFLISLSAASAAHAQSGAERFEVAANLNLLRVSDFGSTNAGLGGRVTVDLTDHVALEGEVGYFPHDRLTSSESTSPGGIKYRLYDDRSRTDALVGVKVGTRTEKYGLFAKAKPGFTRLSGTGGGCLGDRCMEVLAASLLLRTEYRTEFAFDVGGGVEVFPTARTVARVEIGDTIIRHRSTAMPCPIDACTSHNVSSRLGFGWRF